jgi:cellulose synthase/poly-beta-1,6-N-acetylglucosamine synthase-like glycosyltransferase
MNHCNQKRIQSNFGSLRKASQLYELQTQLQKRAMSSEESCKMDDCFSTFYNYYHEMNWPKILVLTLIHSFTEFLDQTINSVTSQDYPNLEYVVISKNPDDQTKEILLKHNYLLSRWIDIPDGMPFNDLRTLGVEGPKGLAIRLQPGETFPDKRWVSRIVNRYSRNGTLPGLIDNYEDYLVKFFSVL